MKHLNRTILGLWIPVISLFILSACDSMGTSEEKDWEPTTYEEVNTLDDVTMTVKEGTVTPTGLTVLFENNSNESIIYSEEFLLEKNIEGKWYRVPVTLGTHYGFEEPAYDVKPSETREMVVDWEWLYGRLDTGEYRIVKKISDFRAPGDYDEHRATAEFAVD